MKVLVVDDSKAMRSIIGRGLRQAGFEKLTIAEASDGEEALKAIGEFGPNLVLSEWTIPGMSGLELLQSARAGGFESAFVFITAEGTPHMRELALGSGATSVIAKPFTPRVLQKTLRGLS